MASTIQVYSIGLATLEMLLIYKLSRYPGVTGEYAASVVGYNFISIVSVYSILTPSVNLYIEILTPINLLITFAGLSAVAADGLMPPIEDPRLAKAVKYSVKFGMVLAVISVLSLAFPAYVGPEHQL